MPRKNSSDSDDDAPLVSFKAPSSLHKPDSLPCEFCEHISTSIYANYEHSATHIVIPLVNLTLYQCEDCLFYFRSLDELTTHANLKKHRTSQVPYKSDFNNILQSIIKKQLVVKCHDLFNDIKYNSRNSTEVSKATINGDENSIVSKTNIITDKVIVKTELPTYVISDSDSNGMNSVSDTERQSIKKEQISDNQEVYKTKPEIITQNIPGMVTQILPNGNSELISLQDRSETPLHSKWRRFSDSDSDECDDANISEDSKLKFYHSDEELTKVDENIFQYAIHDSSPKFKSSPDYEPTRSRLVFEDDFDDDLAEEILPDQPYKPIPNRCLIGTSVTNLKPNSMIIGSHINGMAVSTLNGNGDKTNGNGLKTSDNGLDEDGSEDYPETVPYEVLMKTEICDCRYCGRCFYNRMQLISHETTHLRIRKPRPTLCVHCERFYAGNYRGLRKHLEAKHPHVDPEEKKPQVQVCKVCRLHYYDYTRHVKYYHPMEQGNSQPMVFRKYDKTLHLCDMCLNWSQNETVYKLIGSHSEIGKTQKCYKCKNRHFSINLVSRRRGRPIHGSSISRRNMTNEERLERIKKKLKLIKQLNKCFCCCFIFN